MATKKAAMKTGDKLVIVESPTKAKTIGAFLGKGFVVKSSFGHVRDLPKGKMGVDTEHDFAPTYVIPTKARKTVTDLKKCAAKANEIYFATDEDREGEAISWHLAEVLGDDPEKLKRITFHEITKEAIMHAIEHPRGLDIRMVDAQQARRILDRLVGYELSPFLWKKVARGLSAGRVQSVAVRLVVDREREITAFKAQEYWTIESLFEKQNSLTFPGKLVAVNGKALEKFSIPAKSAADAIVAALSGAIANVLSVDKKQAHRTPGAPFTTSTLQQEANRRLNYSAKQTMMLAQQLYERGFITYMRTDSVNLGAEAVAKMITVIEQEFGKEYAQTRAYKTTSKNAQEAHEAIRPTDAACGHAGATPDEHALYELIRVRTLASQMASAKIMRTNISAKADADIPLFAATGSRTLFPGWLALDTKAKGEDVELPRVAKGDPLTLLSLGEEEKQTEPPNRYTEAGLIKELEKRGIGRPSTYASTMKTLSDREYVEKTGRTLKPTATGMVVSGWLEENFATYISDSFTATMEDELDEIARGERGYKETLSEFYGPFERQVKEKDKLPKATSLGEVSPEFTCPLCGSPMELKLGRGGIFMSCKKYPDCLGARTEEGVELKGDEPIGNDPTTGAPIYIKTGRFGPYVEMALPEPEPRSDLKDSDSRSNLESKKPKKRAKGRPKVAAKRASIPAGTDLSQVTLADALHYLSLPRELGMHPSTGKTVFASTGRFGPYVGSDGEFRSLKPAIGDPYTVTLDTALALLAAPKQPPRGVEIVQEIGKHPKTGKTIVLYKSKQGLFLKKGLRRIYLPESVSPTSFTPAEAAEYLK